MDRAGSAGSGYFTKRLAEDWLRETLDQAWRGTLAGMVRTGATFADAAAEWLRYVEHDRRRKPSTVAGYESIVRSELLPRFGEVAIESITPAMIEAWLGSMTQAASTRTKALVLMHGIFARARKLWELPANPVADVERPPLERSGDLQVFSPEEVWALVRAAASDQDGALFLTAAFTGLRMGELLALRWRDVDFTGSAIRVRLLAGDVNAGGRTDRDRDGPRQTLRATVSARDNRHRARMLGHRRQVRARQPLLPVTTASRQATSWPRAPTSAEHGRSASIPRATKRERRRAALPRRCWLWQRLRRENRSPTLCRA